MTTPAGPDGVRIRAAAKINLHLGVGRPREDGFHPLQTVYQAVSLYDDVTLRRAERIELGLTAAEYVDTADVPIRDPEDNLAVRAVRQGALAHGDADPRIRLDVHKGIPVAGGMAGGSADAAAALLGYDRLEGCGFDDDTLLRLAAELGSDVPFALLGGTALGTGRGEQVHPVADAGQWWWVVVPSPDGGLSTPEVYRRYDALRTDAPATPGRPEALLRALRSGDPLPLAAALHNDLQDAALDLRPQLEGLLADGETAGALRGLVSGSGPTCVFLCAGAHEARGVATQLQATYPVVLVAHGPVAGAHEIGERWAG